jgi:hypothetical protein
MVGCFSLLLLMFWVYSCLLRTVSITFPNLELKTIINEVKVLKCYGILLSIKMTDGRELFERPGFSFN